MRSLSGSRPPAARSSRPPAPSADSIRQAVLLATPSSRATWVAPSSGWAEKQLRTEAAIDTERSDDADVSEGSGVTGEVGVVVVRVPVAGAVVAAGTGVSPSGASRRAGGRSP